MESGAGLERFQMFVEAQGGDPRVAEDLSLLPQAAVELTVHPDRDGYLAAIEPVAIGRAAAALGAGRERLEDEIDPAVGIELLAQVGAQLRDGEPVARILARRDGDAERAAARVLAALTVADAPVQPPPLIHHVIDPGRPG
jgi:thymidine phosphorylase